jgi:hypothetical protein
MNLQTDIFSRYFTLTDNFTNRLNPSVFDSTCYNDRRMYRRIYSVGISNTHQQLYQRYVSVGMSHYHRQDKSVGIFQAGNFFFRVIFFCKTIGKCFFCVADRYSDRRWYYRRTESRRTYSIGEDVGK